MFIFSYTAKYKLQGDKNKLMNPEYPAHQHIIHLLFDTFKHETTLGRIEQVESGIGRGPISSQVPISDEFVSILIMGKHKAFLLTKRKEPSCLKASIAVMKHSD